MPQDKTKTILAIETSCDDTGVAILEFNGKKSFNILVNLTASQTKIHAPFGGVVPNLAARQHKKNLPLLLEKALEQTPKIPDFVAVTHGPGLIPALLVGVSAAKTLGFYFKKPLFAVNHLKGHLAAVLDQEGITLKNFKNIFPSLVLIVSGGHTELVLFKNWRVAKILGETQDDAAGEAFDKVARLLDLPYPGGPEISRLSKEGDSQSFDLPRPMIYHQNFDFSFSGLKTAIFYLTKKIKTKGIISDKQKRDISASFQKAVIDTLTAKTQRAIKKTKVKSLVLAGGVAANSDLRDALNLVATQNKLKFFVPKKENCTDNAQMIAQAAYLDLNHRIKPKKWSAVKANANLSI